MASVTMGFGTSISDVLLCVQLAQNVWQDCRNASSRFGAVTAEVANLEAVLTDIDASKSHPGMDVEEVFRLQKLVDGCRRALKDLQSVLRRHQSLGSANLKLRDKLEWDEDRLGNLRLRVVSSTMSLAAFNISRLRYV